METYLVAGVSHGSHIFREGFEAVPGDEPRGFNIVLCKKLEDSLDADGSGEVAWQRAFVSPVLAECLPAYPQRGGTLCLGRTSANIVGRIFPSIRAQPAGYCVYVNTIAHKNTLLSHVGCGLIGVS